ncbi:hypothetical protein AYL99_10171 [Fonsecaea erecta]|uniref:Protein kinase domain-containing protein n=1 Tax=Fonsecaea erecta TaxID=1367422 RepID=A0A178Z8A6_9EURO|nr:hypothetical protein AYL99_10171 [Fonsecaea erecta]OAP56019.1 hypothetical protein AYL99_10171 [Fonsecaea erecta]
MDLKQARSFTGPDDYRIVLCYDHHRFILVVTKPETREDGDVVSDFFERIEEAENDPDERMFDRCLEDVREIATSACKHTMYALAASTSNPNGKQQSLEDFLHPTTFCLQLRTVQGRLHAVEIDDISEVAGMYEPVRLALDSVPRSFPASTNPSADIEFIQDLQYLWGRSSRSPNMVKFVSSKQQLAQISEKWEPDHPHRPHIPRFPGLRTSAGQVIGMLEEFVDGMNLHEFDVDGVSSAQRRKWKRQIEQSITQLHQSGIVWGDVKRENVLIDEAACAWLVDFGGSSTDGWVDEDRAETIGGDLQGLYRLVKFLGVRH